MSNAIKEIKNTSDLKSLGKKLKEQLHAQNIEITLMNSYDIAARQIGFKDYNTAKAIIEKERYNLRTDRYEFTIPNDELRENILKIIDETIEKTQRANKFFEYSIEKNKDMIIVTFYFDPTKTINEGMYLDVMIISHYRNEIVNKKIKMIKIEKKRSESRADFADYYK